jgi:hypothetical protein
MKLDKKYALKQIPTIILLLVALAGFVLGWSNRTLGIILILGLVIVILFNVLMHKG